jgi:hypothetical protein
MKSMFTTRLKIAAVLLALSLLLGGALPYQPCGMSPPNRAEAGDTAKETATAQLADQFDKVRTLIKPRPGGFDDLSWMTDLWEARKKAAAEGMPLLVWVGDGHPLGWT